MEDRAQLFSFVWIAVCIGNIEENAQILKGIGASCWFYIEKEKNAYRIKRYSEEGKIECSRIFTTETKGFDIKKDFQFFE